MLERITLTAAEKEAKEYILRIVREACNKPCDDDDTSTLTSELPIWFDANKFKRGQHYFMMNRFGMFTSSLYGLITLLAEPQGLRILSSTGKSNTSETARKRYISTILHSLAWYESDFMPDSESWKSIVRSRKLHLNASNASKNKDIGFITQTEMALTTFGFMGIALVKPHHLGIAHNNREDREAFVHVWAVLGSMLGVLDKYNMCLFSLETVEMICLILLRYLFMPLIQMERQEFRVMVTAICEGLSSFLPNMSYYVMLFEVKRILGIPGYQYCVDHTKEIICRQIFTIDEIREIQEILQNLKGCESIELKLPYDIPLIEIEKNEFYCKNKQTDMINANTKLSVSRENFQFYKYLGLSNERNLKISMITDLDWSASLNDSKFYQLTVAQQQVIRIRCFLFKFNQFRLCKYLYGIALDVLLFHMKGIQNNVSLLCD